MCKLLSLLKISIASCLIVSLLVPPGAFAQDPPDPTEIASSALQFGGSLGRLLWVSVNQRPDVTTSEANQYQALASQLKIQMTQARAATSVLRADFDLAGATIAYGAAADPEPITKVLGGVAAWSVKKGGDAISESVLEQTQEQIRGVLAEGLQNKHISEGKLRSMTADQLGAMVGDMKIGGETLKEALKDDPKALALIQDDAIDMASRIGVDAIAHSEATQKHVDAIQQDLDATNQKLEQYQTEVQDHLTKIDTSIAVVEHKVSDENAQLANLNTLVGDQGKALATVAEISYSGWSTEQKIQALDSGLFPDLNSAQKDAMLKALQAQQARESAVADLQAAAQDFGNLGKIAHDIGLPDGIVQGLQGAQLVSTGIAKFASGDILGGIASLTSLIGLGGPDEETVHYEAMMHYLEGQFAQVNQKLDEIVDLQVKTIQALGVLEQEQEQFRQEVLTQLDRIENEVLRTNDLAQAILLTRWQDCRAMINTPGMLNGQYQITDRNMLRNLVASIDVNQNASQCYNEMNSFLKATVPSADWAGQIIDGSNFPSSQIQADPDVKKAWDALETQQDRAYKTAREFILSGISSDQVFPTAALVRFAQPVVTANASQALRAALVATETASSLQAFTCDRSDILSVALHTLACIQVVSPDPPIPGTWRHFLNAPLIGPYAKDIVKTGITLSNVIDFSTQSPQGGFTFVDPKLIDGFMQTGMRPELQSALNQKKGVALLMELDWLTNAFVVQQGIAYGDYTAELAEQALYDSASRTLSSDLSDPLRHKALDAMHVNPVLARNVVLLGVRHAIADALGGSDKAEKLRYRQTYYNLGIRSLSGSQACDGSAIPREVLANLLPGWKILYYASTDDKKSAAFNACPDELPDQSSPAAQFPTQGAGLGVDFGDFHVLLPDSMRMYEGSLEQTATLQHALGIRDEVAQAIIDRKVAETVNGVTSGATDATRKMSFALINEGWGWQTRKK